MPNSLGSIRIAKGNIRSRSPVNLQRILAIELRCSPCFYHFPDSFDRHTLSSIDPI
ncbi:MAG: hypothetical protein KME17_24925 [Cyanosarcina radialis HA8281-LM2]|nr:hypothetical protein [Cyanosarcina radialis HA8281-LM2]